MAEKTMAGLMKKGALMRLPASFVFFRALDDEHLPMTKYVQSAFHATDEYLVQGFYRHISTPFAMTADEAEDE